MIDSNHMLAKMSISILCCALFQTFAISGEAMPIERSGLVVMPAKDWTRQPGTSFVLRGPERDGLIAPRFAISIVADEPLHVIKELRDRFRRIAAHSSILDEDTVPIGGRAWYRLRTRFAIGPIVLGQSIWIGLINNRTVIGVLSAGDEVLPLYLDTALKMVASLKDQN